MKHFDELDTSIEPVERGRLLAVLERMFEIQATDVSTALSRAAEMVVEALNVDKIDIFLYEPESATLVALGVSDTEMGRLQKSIGLDRLPLANGGRVVEVFQTGKTYFNGYVDEDTGELPGIRQSLGVRSLIAVAYTIATERRGVLAVSSAQPEFFTTRDVSFVEIVAHWVGMVAHRAELVEQVAREAAEQGRRVAAEELVTVLAHDLRNYLTPLRGHIEMIQRRATREQRERDMQDAAAATSTLQRFTRLISDLLDVARLDQGIFSINPEPVNLVQILREIATSLRRATNEVLIHSPEELVVFVDAGRIRQALENLIANAMNHSPAGTPVVLNASTQQRNDGTWVAITISDMGPGIPGELLPNLFQPFVSGASSTGLGLGLYLASRIVAAHGGTLTVESKLGEGAHFQLALPQHQQP